jgi:hypothetical protein
MPLDPTDPSIHRLSEAARAASDVVNEQRDYGLWIFDFSTAMYPRYLWIDCCCRRDSISSRWFFRKATYHLCPLLGSGANQELARDLDTVRSFELP